MQIKESKVLYIWNMISKDDILNKLRDLKPELYRDYSVMEIGLFGSFGSLIHSPSAQTELIDSR